MEPYASGHSALNIHSKEFTYANPKEYFVCVWQPSISQALIFLPTGPSVHDASVYQTGAVNLALVMQLSAMHWS